MIHQIDLHFQGFQKTIASFLIETGEGPVLIETGPFTTYPNLEKGIQALGYTPEDIKHVLLTHIHFDHAGAAWALAEKGAQIYVHPVGAKHMAHPEKFVASARKIYQEQMDSLFGTINPIPENQITSVNDQETLDFGGTHIKGWHTPGHAIHHIAWQIDGNLFTGDVAGVRINNGIVIPPCPPPDINLEAWQNSLDLIKNMHPEKLWLSHFGPYTDITNHLDGLEKRMYAWADWIKSRWENGDDPDSVKPDFQNLVAHELSQSGLSDSDIQLYEVANPSWMSVAGLMRYWRKRKEKEGQG